MNSIHRKSSRSFGVVASLAFLIGIFVLFSLTSAVGAQAPVPKSGERLISLHDNGRERGILTKATTLREAFAEAGVLLDPNDIVEPGLDETLVASNYDVNLYRARPVTVVDGTVRQKVMSAYQTPKQIAQHAGITLQDEDIATVESSPSIVEEGAGVKMSIDRATEFTFVLYGKKMQAYTQAATVGEMLAQKSITLGVDDGLSLALETPITTGITLELWRNGKQTLTEEQDVAFAVEKVQDADRPIGYKQIKSAGVPGKRTVTYEIEVRDGKEVARKEIQSLTTKEPVKQVEIIGVKSTGGLSKAKGVYFFKDSQGVVHRETYYDLPMSRVMANCGAGGLYSVRADGTKVDKSGYVIIAANLNRYPRCSVVETSLGPGKVYDTGGFAAVHPDGFDLATDWSNNDGN